MMHKLWDKLPEWSYKEHIRILQRNYLHSDRAKFSLQEGIFSVKIDGVTFRTIDHPFGVAEEHYQAKYKLKQGDIGIDAGAFNGHISLLFSLKVGKSGRIIAIEPDEKNLALLQKNILLNQSVQNLTMIGDILWSSNGEVEFSEQGGVGSSALYKPEGQRMMIKKAITIDSLVENLDLPKLNLIKMDIEGAEIDALLGAVDCIKKYRPNFAIASYHIVNNTPTRFAVEQLLEQYGYVVETIFYGSECITYGSS
jgi:FkbM family methyltransferase